MRLVKGLLTTAIIAAALLAALIALFWRQLLTPEQKLGYGLYGPAARGFAERAGHNPENAQSLGDYVSALTAEGNFGRALYLARLHGAESKDLDELLPVLEKCRRAVAAGETYDASKDPAVRARKSQPVQQVMLYLDGYQFALLGDWASAKNNLEAIETKKLPPELRPLQQYYLARAWRLAGDAEQQAQAVELFRKLVAESPYPPLRAKARYNLAAYYLSPAYEKADAADKAAVMLSDLRLAQVSPLPSTRWALQKTLVEFAQHEWDQGNTQKAWGYSSEAVLAGPGEKAAQGAAELCFEILAALRKGSRADGQPLSGEASASKPEFKPGIFAGLATAAIHAGLEKQAAGELGRLKGQAGSKELRTELASASADCLTAAKDLAGLKPYLAQANLLGASDSAVARLYLQYAGLLEEKEQYNEALSYYNSAAQLGTAEAGEALLGSYRILKDVQEPLNLDRAEELLNRIVASYPGSSAYGKAVEELLPLLIYRGRSQAANKLAGRITDGKVDSRLSAAEKHSQNRLRNVANYWLGYIADKTGGDADSALKEVPLRYFGYFELGAGAELLWNAEPPALLFGEESTVEYLAGLGLADEAAELLADEGREAGPVELLCEVYYNSLFKPVHSQQYECTELLESGAPLDSGDPALLRYVLEQAYPMPYREAVEQFSAQSGVPMELIYAVAKKESNFREDATSWVGASGLMQLMPGTVRFLIDARGLPADSLARRNEPEVSLRLGTAYLDSLHDELAGQLQPAGPKWAQGHSDSPSLSFGGDAMLRAILHSYNGGPANYKKWRGLYSGADSVLLTDLVPNEQNEGYVKLVWKYTQVYGMLLNAQ